MSRKVVLLGSTGSIGTQSLDVLRGLDDRVVGLGAGGNIKLLEQQVREFRPEYVSVVDKMGADDLRRNLADLNPPPRILAGQDSAALLVAESHPDIVLNAIVGIAGLDSTLTALAGGADVALANKESLVAGGELVLRQAEATGAMLLPVDSEHSAIFQCLQDKQSAKVLEKIILTASGGPFYGMKTAELSPKTRHDALRHPNWDMGAKITIDSATLMNKGLELIEAMWLFGLPPEKIEIVVQRQSIVHSMVEFCDHSVLAQLGVPDMRIPIQYALTWPKRVTGPAPALDFSTLSRLDFGLPDEQSFRCLAACRKAAAKGGLAPCAANGANEQAVDLFLQDKIGFLEIGRLVEACVDSDSFAGSYSIDDVVACDQAARRFVLDRC